MTSLKIKHDVILDKDIISIWTILSYYYHAIDDLHSMGNKDHAMKVSIA